MLFSLYFHIPFCVHRCAYCDFNTYAGQDSLLPAYVDALCREIEYIGCRLPVSAHRGGAGSGGGIHTIFFGGGTPSLLTPQQFEQVFRAIRKHFDPSDAETSLEANPGAVSLDYLRDLRSLGFNRISFGVQSFHPDELRQLERSHDPFDAFAALGWARRAGFDNLNLDLIYGLPQQLPDRWSASVRWAVDLAPEHLSLYALTFEHGTPFGRWAARGLLPVPDPDTAAQMYESAGDILEANGFQQYEISNWSRTGRQCQHNLQYWRNLPYLGLGAGAHGYAAGVRYSNVLRIRTYIDRMTSSTASLAFPFTPSTMNQRKVSARTRMQESLMLGLRLTDEGISNARFVEQYGLGIRDAFPDEVDDLLRLGLVEWASDSRPPVHLGSGLRLRLTPRARLVANQVFIRFVE